MDENLENLLTSTPVTQHEKQLATEEILNSSSVEGEHSDSDAFQNFIQPFSILQKLFYCGVCLENCSCSLGFKLSGCVEGHTYCKPCMEQYYTALVTDGCVDHFCPGVATCKASLTLAETRALLSTESLLRYERITQVKRNPLYRECPSCGKGATASDDASSSPELQCESCGCRYCFFHASAHPGVSCAQYARNQSARTRREQAATVAVVRSTTKECPYCKSPTEKNGGCNHM